jgi:rare lipoprotein A
MTACVALTSLLTIGTQSAPLATTPPKTALVLAAAPEKPKPWNAGFASWYGSLWEGRKTASGEIFEKDNLTAAHRTLPFGTVVKVTDTQNGKSVVVRINDRGTLTPERVIDLSSGAAEKLGILESGIARVKLEILKKVGSKPAASNPA